jgi:hypothetical protein
MSTRIHHPKDSNAAVIQLAIIACIEADGLSFDIVFFTIYRMEEVCEHHLIAIKTLKIPSPFSVVHTTCAQHWES